MGAQPQGADFRSMTKEELANYINSQQSEAVQPTGESNIKDDQIDEESPSQDNSAESDEDNQDTSTTVDDQGNADPAQDNQQPKGNQFEGKTYDELLSIIKEQQSFIGRQGSMIGDLKKLATQAKPEEKPAPKEEPIDAKGYKEEDVQFIRELIHNEFGSLNKRQQQKAEQEKQQAYEENQQMFQTIQKDPVLYNKLKPVLDRRFVKAGKSAIYQKGWVKSAVDSAMMDLIRSDDQQQAPKAPAGRKPPVDKTALKKKAATLQGGGGTPPKAPSKNVKEMSADEYLKYVTEKMGVKNLRRK